jgi:hypothetical protein
MVAWYRHPRLKLVVPVAVLSAVSSGFLKGQEPSPVTTSKQADASSSEPNEDTAFDAAAKWKHFSGETFTPLTLVSGAFNAGVSHVSNSDPRYGQNAAAYAQRFGASVADIASQNFFGDFVFASAFHEDPRYFRKGPEHGLWSRVGYAISRSVIIHKDRGGNTFNWSNVVGTAASAGLSNAYYPSPSRTSGAMAIRFGTSIAGAGFANLLPEFWPDFRQWMKRRFEH